MQNCLIVWKNIEIIVKISGLKQRYLILLTTSTKYNKSIGKKWFFSHKRDEIIRRWLKRKTLVGSVIKANYFLSLSFNFYFWYFWEKFSSFFIFSYKTSIKVGGVSLTSEKSFFLSFLPHYRFPFLYENELDRKKKN